MGSKLMCAHCKKRDATCVGMYDNMEEELHACDECCGHCGEDGYCEPIGSDSERDELRSEYHSDIRSDLRRQRLL